MSRYNTIDPVPLIDGLSQHDFPQSATFLEKVVKASVACDVDGHAMNNRTLADCHLGLRDRSSADDINDSSGKPVQHIKTGGRGGPGACHEGCCRRLHPG